MCCGGEHSGEDRSGVDADSRGDATGLSGCDDCRAGSSAGGGGATCVSGAEGVLRQQGAGGGGAGNQPVDAVSDAGCGAAAGQAGGLAVEAVAATLFPALRTTFASCTRYTGSQDRGLP